ncbi:hypothetical protein J1614_004907 [Plenodomus biglobosus]|nr:hypothetical protein J1614_004907 [Plenodomus biglobosus]
MAESLRLYLVRHGETVDNVAQLLAGSRDSELTNHGFQQATRLGLHYRSLGLKFTHLFSSHLQRAAKTAGKIREGQLGCAGGDDNTHRVPEVVQLPLLAEQDFGSMEGKKWTTQSAHATAPGKPAGDFVAAETKESMGKRADMFLDEHLIPLLNDPSAPSELVIAVVSHGIFLSTLWKRILRRLPPKSVIVSLDSPAAPLPSLEHLGGWSNTGYLELCLAKSATVKDNPPIVSSVDVAPLATLSASESSTSNEADHEANDVVEPPLGIAMEPGAADPLPRAGVLGHITKTTVPGMLQGWTTCILTINGKDHLIGLKRTGGGPIFGLSFSTHINNNDLARAKIASS